MAHLTIRVPEPHVAALRRELVRAYDECVRAAASEEADDLLEAVEQLPAEPDDLVEAVERLPAEPDDLVEAVEQLPAEPDDLVEAIAAQPEKRAGAVEVTAHPEVLSDAVHAVLAAALAELSAAVEAYWRGADVGTAVAERVAEVSSLADLFRSVQDG